MFNPNRLTLDDYLRAIKELKLERSFASCDFYPNRREALDLAIYLLEQKADDFLRQE